jgi:hypothetical protein
MATWQYELADAPAETRALELWLQHAAGFILFEDVRRYAIEQIDPELKNEARAAVQKGIDDALYGLMMIIDGETGGLSNSNRRLFIDFLVRLTENDEQGRDAVRAEINLREGDGMSMGYHGWLEGDFGAHPIAAPRPDADV